MPAETGYYCNRHERNLDKFFCYNCDGEGIGPAKYVIANKPVMTPKTEKPTWDFEKFKRYVLLFKKNYIEDSLWGKDPVNCSDEFSEFTKLEPLFRDKDNTQIMIDKITELEAENQKLREDLAAKHQSYIMADDDAKTERMLRQEDGTTIKTLAAKLKERDNALKNIYQIVSLANKNLGTKSPEFLIILENSLREELAKVTHG